MTDNLALQMGDLVARMTASELEQEIKAPVKLRLQREDCRGKTIEIAWAPFDHVNAGAAVAIVGITPGRQQMGNALRSYREARQKGIAHLEALSIAKVHASFSGDLRSHLVDMLDHIGLNGWLGLASSAALWDTRTDLAHFTSSLRYPVFINGKNYTGDGPRMLKAASLRKTVETVLAAELAALPSHTVIVPLGGKVDEALMHAAALVPGFDTNRLLCGLPHPSPGNRGEIYPFLGLPSREGRVRPVPASIGERREALRQKVAQLPVRPVSEAA